MHSCTLTAIGDPSCDPQPLDGAKRMCARLCPSGHDEAGGDDESGERALPRHIRVIGFAAVLAAIARNSSKRGQLIIEAQVRADRRADHRGERRADCACAELGSRLGAPGGRKRAGRPRRAGRSPRDMRSRQRPRERSGGCQAHREVGV